DMRLLLEPEHRGEALGLRAVLAARNDAHQERSEERRVGKERRTRGRLSTRKKTSIKLRKCSSKITTSIFSFISGRLVNKSNEIKLFFFKQKTAYELST